MVGDIIIADEIFIVCNSTDMRKSIDGLCVIIRDHLQIEPETKRAIFLFCGKRRDRIKILYKVTAGHCYTSGWITMQANFLAQK